MKSYFYLLFSFLWTGLLMSCTAPIDIDTDDSEPVIVIYGVLTDDTTYQSVRISSSSPYFADQPNPAISGAKVSISTSENEVFLLQENDTAKGLYQTEKLMAGVPGVAYTLQVEVDFNRDGLKEIYQASTLMQEPIKIDSINLKIIHTMGLELYAVNLYGEEPPTKDYYLCKYLVNDSLITNHISQYEQTSDEIFDGQYIEGMTLRHFGSINSKDRFDDEDEVLLSPGDKVTLNISRIDKGYFDFITQSQSEMRGENPFFGGPASNIKTNFSNGAVGYFTGYSITRASNIAP